MGRAYRVAVVVLLAALFTAVIVQGNRIIRAMSYTYTPDTQDVRVVNGGNDRVPVELPAAQQPETPQEQIDEAGLTRKFQQAIKGPGWQQPAAASTSGNQ